MPSIRSNSLDSSVSKKASVHKHTCGKGKDNAKNEKTQRSVSLALAPPSSSSPSTPQYITVNHYHRGRRCCRGGRHVTTDNAIQTDPIAQKPFEPAAAGEKPAQSEPIPQKPFQPLRSGSDIPSAATIPEGISSVHSTTQLADELPSVLFNMPPFMQQQFPPPPPPKPPHMYFAPPMATYYPHQPFCGAFDPRLHYSQLPPFLRTLSERGTTSKRSPTQQDSKDLTQEEQQTLIGIHEHYEKNHAADIESPAKQRDEEGDKGSVRSTKLTMNHQHVCAGCGNIQSMNYQLKHLLKDRERPKAAFCRRCEARNNKTDNESSDHMRARRGRQLSISYVSTQEESENSHGRDESDVHNYSAPSRSRELPARREHGASAEYRKLSKTKRSIGRRRSASGYREAAYREESRRQSERVQTAELPPSRRPSTSYRREPTHFGNHVRPYQVSDCYVTEIRANAIAAVCSGLFF